MENYSINYENFKQQILHTKAFSVKLQIYGLYRLILTL